LEALRREAAHLSAALAEEARSNKGYDWRRLAIQPIADSREITCVLRLLMHQRNELDSSPKAT